MIARILFIGVFASVAFAQISGVPARKPLADDMLVRVRPVVDAIYRLDYTTAERLCQQLIRDFPEHPAGYVYRLRVYWSEELSKARLVSAERVVGMDLFSESPKFTTAVTPEIAERYRRSAEDATERAHAWARQHPDDVGAQFLLGLAYGIESGYEFSIDHSRLRASQNAAKTFDVLRELIRHYPDVVDARVVTGAFSVIADSLDLKTSWLAWLLGYRGNLEVGRQDMELAAEKGFLENDDARTLLAIVYTRQGKFDRAMEKLTELHTRYPENYLVHLDIAALETISNHPEQALNTYRQILAKDYPNLERAAVLTRIGVAQRMAGDFAGSERSLREAAEVSNISAVSLGIARLELGKTLDLRGQRSAAIEQYRRVLQAADLLGLHQDADRWIRKPFDRAAMRQDSAAGGVITVGLTPAAK
jgi:tetratricopeptide (TPR) repeat protein